ncbi:TonB-dependent receptor [Flagellimonas algicola]|uniref:TonB-dependent receptor n=2 Tax=Flagellimonas algicola TaxID=2583815 RepID=A0ABY2WGE5_9FLAO|nr:TonB-dependent receptor [Allomuricauda algicola]
MKKPLTLTSRSIPLLKFDLKMKLSMLLLLIAVFSARAHSAFGQGTKVTLNLEKVKVERFIDEIESTTDFRFIYKIEDVDLDRSISIKVQKEDIEEILGRVFGNTETDFTTKDRQIYLIRRKAPEVSDKSDKKVVKEVLQQTVSGTVTDMNGQPLPGASIVEKGTINGTSTDFDGNFKLETDNENAILVVSYIGFTTKEVSLDGQLQVIITLSEDSAKLDEVVVVGYGTQSKARITGAISKVNVAETEKTGFLGTDDVLQGRVAGLQVSSTSGTPGGQQRINIRGIGSLQGDNLPLFVIDGIPINISDPSGINVFGEVNNQSPLSLLNPNDIASIDVLKDAASTAIYGSRGTNGVIIITTKKGRTGKGQVNVSSYTGIQFAPQEIKPADTALWLEVNNEARANFNSDQGLNSGDEEFLAPLDNPLPSGETEFDWIGALTRETSRIQDYNISMSGGNENTTYYASLGYFDQEGWFIKSRFQRFSNKLSIEHKFSDKVGAGVNFIGNFTDNSRVASHEGGVRLLIRGLEQRPADPAFIDGFYNVGGSATLTRHNGLQVVEEQDSQYRIYRGILNAFVEIRPFKGFSYTPSFNIDYGTYHDNTYRSPFQVRGRNFNGQVLDSRNILSNVLVENLFNYQKSWNDLDLKVTAAHSFQKQVTESSLIDARNLPSPSFRAISSAAEQFAFGAKTENALDSYLGRISGTFKDRYFLDLSFRRDGSSRFASGKKYGNFPSASMGWVISREPFFKENDFLSFLKLRASYGVTGSTSSIGNYNSLALVSGGADYLGQSGLTANQLENPNLTWEQSSSFNVGVDLALLDNKVSITAEYYTKDTDDLLFDRPVHGTTGFTTFSENIGKLTSNGFELAITASIINKEDFSWNVDFNIATANNELKSLIGDEAIPIGYNVLKVGESIGSFYLLKQIGIYQSDAEVPASLAANGVRAGDVIYEDINGDGQINASDRQVVGNAFPDVFGGLNNTLRYKNFDLTVFSNFSFGNDIFSAWRSGGFLAGGSAGSIRVGGGVEGLGFTQFGQLKETAENRWTGPGTSNNVPRAIAGGTGAAFHNNQASSRWVEDASFFRIKNITLGYTLPNEVSSKLSMDTLRFYLTGNNLFTITDYMGYDPEASDSSDPRTFGADFLTPPPLRTVILGVNVKF